MDLLLISSGVVTGVPLLFFAAAARRVPLTVMGMLQYITPVLQFLIGIFLRHEALPGFGVGRLRAGVGCAGDPRHRRVAPVESRTTCSSSSCAVIPVPVSRRTCSEGQPGWAAPRCTCSWPLPLDRTCKQAAYEVALQREEHNQRDDQRDERSRRQQLPVRAVLPDQLFEPAGERQHLRRASREG